MHAVAGPTGPRWDLHGATAGTGVWVEFEGGDADKPIWTGCRFALSNVPPLALAGNPADPNICIQSLLQNMIMVSDMPPSPITGGIILKSTLGAMIVVNDTGIYISNGKGAMITMMVHHRRSTRRVTF